MATTKRLVVAGICALAAACVTRMPMPMPRMEMPEMPDEAQIREMMDRSRGKPALPEQPDQRQIQVVFQTGHAGPITAVGLSRDGRQIVSASGDETAKLWDVASGQEVRTFAGSEFGTRTASFVGDSQRIALGGLAGGRLIDGTTGRTLPSLGEELAGQAIVSADGSFGARTRGFDLDPARARRSAATKPGITIVDLITDRVIATLAVDNTTAPVAISDDGRVLLATRTEVDNDRATKAALAGKIYQPIIHVEVWDVATGKRRHELPATLVGVTTSALSPDGSLFVLENYDQTLTVYDVLTAQAREPIRTGKGRPGSGTSLVFSRDGRMLARASQEGRVQVWRMPEAQLVTEFEGTAVAFSADGTKLVAGRSGGGAPFLRDLASGVEKPMSGGASAITDLALVADGASVVAATQTSGARHWNLASGELLRTFSCPGGGSTYTVSMSRVARWLATGCQDGAAYVWNLDTGAQLRTFLTPLVGEYTPAVVRFDPTGRRLAVGRGGELAVWDVAENREIRRVTLPDGPRPFYANADEQMNAMENLPEAQRQAIREATNDPAAQRAMMAIQALEFHPDGRRIAISKGATFSLWDIERGQLVREYSLAAARAIEQAHAKPAQQASGDEQLLAKLMSGGKLSRAEMKRLSSMSMGKMPQAMMRNPGDGAEEMIEALDERMEGMDLTREFAFSADGTWLHSLSATGPRIWEVETGRRIRKQRSSAMDPSDPDALMRQLEEREVGVGDGLALSPDGRYGARGFGRMIKVWELATDTVVAEMLGHTSDVTSLAYVSGGRLLVTGARDGTVRVWDMARRQELVQLIAVGASDYVAVTPDQFYRTSRRGIGGVAFRVDGRLYPFEQFDLRFNRPDVVLERLGRAAPEMVQGYRAAYQRRLKKLGFTEDRIGGEFHLPVVELSGQVPVTTAADSLSVRVRAGDDKYPLDRLNVFVNDVPVFGTAGVSIPDRAARRHEQEIRVPLVAGRNKIQVSVLNQQGAESLRQTAYATSTAPAATPDVYVVAIGVSRYQRESYSLRFAAKDATDLMSAYRALAQRPGAVGNVHVLELTDSKATRSSIRNARRWLEQARVNDLVVLFAAGHGMTDASSNYYFGTYDIDPEQPANAGLPYAEFEALLDGIPAMQKLMLIDTCFSGEIDKDETVTVAQADTGGAGTVQMRAFKASRGVTVVADSAGMHEASATAAADVTRFQQELFADLRRGTGAVVISSASGNEYALEGEQWANGVFTYALLDGLTNGRADANRDQVISVSELQAHVLDQVRRLTAGGQNPTVRRENLEYDFRVY